MQCLVEAIKVKDNILLCLVTVDETLVHSYEPENKAQSRQWVGSGSLRPKKFKTPPSAGKVMATVFWDARGVIMLDFLPKRSKITGVYYANLLDQLRTVIREKCRDKLSKSALLLFLFPNLKKDIRGCHFRSEEEVVTAVEEWVNGKVPDFFSSGLLALEHRWSRCVTLEGNYIEKEEVDLNRK